MRLSKSSLKDALGGLPWFPELYWQVRNPGRSISAKFDLTRLQNVLPGWVADVIEARHGIDRQSTAPKNVFLFATQRYWLEHVTLLGMAFAGQMHKVSLGYLPYAEWMKPLNRFDARRQSIYIYSVLSRAEPLLQLVPFLGMDKAAPLPGALQQAIELTSLRDTQYTLQVEDVSTGSELYRLRLERNLQAARIALGWLRSQKPDVIVVPNGTILEFGAVYQTARYLEIPTVTYEFGEQCGHLWLAQDGEVMRQETNDLWAARGSRPLDAAQIEQVQALFTARQRASLWQNFARRWQGTPSEGGAKVRTTLGLDARPVVLLATNVIGDSLTLGRQVFSDSMTEWLERTVRWFAEHGEAQLIIRIHPGELITKGPSVADVVRRAVPDLPPHIYLIPADAPLNTYDIVEVADLGLVYTTTVGMELAMSGVPAIAVGNTHYRGKGFTLDADSWNAYFEMLAKVLADPQAYRLTRQQVDLAWNYAYRFFFEYPHPFPWHLLHFWKDLQAWPLGRVLAAEGQEEFGETLRYLCGEKVIW
ncbi:MAG: hypothetical protein ACOYYS_02160 [Chloroflexota bacterium]